MAIIITKQDCNLSDVNAFYRVESSNMSFIPATTFAGTALSTARHINLSFANAGNFKGAGFVVYSSVAGDRSFACHLQHALTATLAIASPGVVGLVSHGLAVGVPVQFTTTGTLPTGVVSNTVYYARNTDCAIPADQFWLYGTAAQAIAGGATGRINFTVAESGVHSCWIIRSTEVKPFETIRGGFTSPVTTSQDKLGLYVFDMRDFDVNYAVTTAATTWRFRVYQSGGTTGTLNIFCGEDATNFSYWAYCDNTVSFTDGDTPIFANYCEINQTASFNAVLGVGATVRGCAGVICSNQTALTTADVSFLKCTSPVASYTLTLNGHVYMGGHSGMRIGSSTSAITTANRFILNTGAGTVGTQRGALVTIIGVYTASQYYGSRSSFFAYGAYPTKIRTYLTSDAIITGNSGLTCTMTIANPCVVTRAAHGYTGSEPVIFTSTGYLPSGGTATLSAGTTYYVKYVNASTFRLSTTPGGADLSTLGGTQSGTHYFGEKSILQVAEDMSLQGWSTGDTIVVGKQNVQGQGNLVALTIESISGTNITLTHVLPQYSRLSGGSVINYTATKYGVNIVDTGTNTAGALALYAANNINIEGCYLKGIYASGVSVRASDDDANANLQIQTFKNSVCQNNGTVGLYCFYNMRLPRLGLVFDNVWGWQCVPEYGIFPATATVTYKSGTLTMNNVGVLSQNNYYMGISAKCLCNFTNLYIENGAIVAGYGIVLNLGAGSIVDGIYVYGDSLLSSVSYGVIGITSVSINSTIRNVYITNSFNGLLISAAAVTFGLVFDNVVMLGNTGVDINVQPGAFATIVFKNCSGISTRSYTDLTDATDGTCLSYTNYGGISKNDFDEGTWGNFQRTGGVLADTTTHTVGSTKYAIRMQNTLQGNPLEWRFTVPTGDIMNQTMIIGVWVKINSSNYYSNIYNKPKMTVNYDDGILSTYVEATNSTDWQYILLPVTPTTSFGQVEVIISTDTDQAGSDAYVYFDDMTVFYPAGIVLSLGGLDLWSNGFPIVPPISTSVNALDIWAAAASAQITPGSMGMLVKTIDTTTKNNQALILGK